MGRVRALYIKRAARELIARYPGKLSTEFKGNRKFVDEVLVLGHLNKSVRNRIAGYIVTLLKQRKDG